MNPETIRKHLDFLKNTPLHPQWLVFREGGSRFDYVAFRANGVVLDIGCTGMELETRLPHGCHYIGLDYPATAGGMYRTRPDLFADAQKLPFRNNSMDTIVFLEVMEHLPEPQLALHEIERVLTDGGKLIMSVPFMYPVHDAPYDYQRFTEYALRRSAEEAGLVIDELEASGHPVTTACLLLNLALTRTAMNALREKHPSILMIPLLPAIVPLLNGFAWLSEKLTPSDSFMPKGYTLTLTRK